MSFPIFFDRIISHEGGYVNDPRDPGGETNWGITRRTARANGYTGSMRSMTRTQARDIYRKAYWERYRCALMPSAVAFQLFDACINHGFGNAARMLQRAAGVLDDGVIGEVSMAAINRMDEDDLLMRFAAERLDFYARLTTFNTFGRGWIRRVAANLRHAAADNKDQTCD